MQFFCSEELLLYAEKVGVLWDSFSWVGQVLRFDRRVLLVFSVTPFHVTCYCIICRRYVLSQGTGGQEKEELSALVSSTRSEMTIIQDVLSVILR